MRDITDWLRPDELNTDCIPALTGANSACFFHDYSISSRKIPSWGIGLIIFTGGLAVLALVSYLQTADESDSRPSHISYGLDRSR
ncbi:MAG: hypothetical protein A3E87_01130 [Gammaproteobacteria bacterium RIFCSPHIGHO2_12_FULL_35_23]|nr:MAG: hypothetical protein A3E87_01130 [Gammaproteobacteria bacterium RIFCSPHIGHO2_12_FULL_35_23]